MKERDQVNVELTINIEAVHAAAVNATDLQNVAFEVPVLNPRMLTIDSKIHGFKVVPVDDQVNKKDMKDEDARCIAIQSVVVDSLDKNTTPGCITVNGRYDIPIENGTLVDLPNVWLASEADAIAIAEVLTEVELNKALETVERKRKIADFLKEQLDNKRF